MGAAMSFVGAPLFRRVQCAPSPPVGEGRGGGYPGKTGGWGTPLPSPPPQGGRERSGASGVGRGPLTQREAA